MSEDATIRKVEGGYILHIRYPYAGSPLGGGEIVCATFDDAVTKLYLHLHCSDNMIGKRCKVEIVERSKGGE